ncbi:hypothetical protein M9434_006684 [Picochlorum sp. BPE23]|nr:hypothetical protein M9434_006684 [Picochlorum sp. BPE23]
MSQKGEETNTSDQHVGKLPPSLTTRIFDSIRSFIPERFHGPFREHERGLLLLERRIQRDFLNDYRKQARVLEPIIRERGVAIGKAIRSSFVSGKSVTVTYDDAKNSGPPFGVSESTAELLKTVEPLLSPIMDPFLDGVKQPINEKLKEVEKDIRRAFVVGAGVSFITGFVIARLTHRRRNDA